MSEIGVDAETIKMLCRLLYATRKELIEEQHPQLGPAGVFEMLQNDLVAKAAIETAYQYGERPEFKS